MLIRTCLREISLPYIPPVLKPSHSDLPTTSKGRGLSCVDPYPRLSHRSLSQEWDEGVALDGHLWDPVLPHCSCYRTALCYKVEGLVVLPPEQAAELLPWYMQWSR